MKISIAISILILAAAAILGWTDRRRLESAKETHRSLASEAAPLGLSIDLESSDGAALVTKRPREDRDAKARLAAKELIAFALEMKAAENSGQQPDGAMQDRIEELTRLILTLDAGQVKILIAEFRASTEMEDETRDGMIMFAITTLMTDRPEAVLTILTESEGLDNGVMGSRVLSNTLASMAKTDPDGALEWVKKNGEKYPNKITDDLKAGLVTGAGSKNMALGFDVLRELKWVSPDDAIGGLARLAGSPAERTEFMSLLRDYRKDNPKLGEDVSANAMHSLAEGIVKDGFAEGSAWIDANKLSPAELDALAGRMGVQAKSSEKGQWIAWMGQNLSGEGMDSHIASTMEDWTRTDYRAAGEWLVAAPAGAAKDISVSAYAETVARYDPNVAEQWALTMAPGEKRQETLQSIHGNWPKDSEANKAERAAFAEKYGIK